MRNLMVGRSWLKEWLIVDLYLLLIGGLYYSFINIVEVTCLIKGIFGIDCPTCKMTRALLSLVKLDFYGYFINNCLALPTATMLYMNMHAEFFDKKRLNVGTIVTAIAVFVKYILNFIV